MATLFSTRLSAGLALLATLAGCQSQSGQKVAGVFNEGVALSLQAAEQPDTARARPLERQAIGKYRQALAQDSAHRMVRAALGHSYYLLDKYPEAIAWFEASNKVDPASAASYRELGLSRISQGSIQQGWADLQQAFRLDSSAKIRAVTADDLYNLGRRAFDYGQAYAAGGEAGKGAAYQKYAVSVLQMAYVTDRTRKDVARTLAELAAQANQTPARRP
jgi:tetratricopeptide (TPR) repeat protein